MLAHDTSWTGSPHELCNEVLPRPSGGFDDVPGDDIKIEEPGQRAMPDILEFAPQHRHRFFAAFYSSFLFHWILTS